MEPIITQSEIKEKERRARELLKRKNLASLAFSTQANFAWATCGKDNHVGIATELGSSTALITSDRKYIVCDNIEACRILDEEVSGLGFEVVSYNWYEGSLADKLRELTGSGSIGADTPIQDTNPIEADFAPYRCSLTPEEVERYRMLGKNAGECMNAACRALKPGMTEYGIAAMLASGIFERGMIPTLILVATDERISKYRHPIPTGKQLERYAMLVIGVKRWGLIISMTRLVHFDRLPFELRSKHDSVAYVDATFIANTRPGADVADIFNKGVAEYSSQGFGEEWQLHHQGGPTGYKGRDYRAGAQTHNIVAQNQAFAWNPSITGTKSEDTIIATVNGPLIISAIEDWPTVKTPVGGLLLTRPDILLL